MMQGFLIVMVSPVLEHRLEGSRASVAVASGPQSTGSVAAAHRLCGSSACGGLPGARMEPTSSALAGSFLITRPPGKSQGPLSD